MLAVCFGATASAGRFHKAPISYSCLPHSLPALIILSFYTARTISELADCHFYVITAMPHFDIADIRRRAEEGSLRLHLPR